MSVASNLARIKQTIGDNPVTLIAVSKSVGADRVQEALGTMFMDIVCSHCGSDKVIRAGACGVCTECGTSQGCS